MLLIILEQFMFMFMFEESLNKYKYEYVYESEKIMWICHYELWKKEKAEHLLPFESLGDDAKMEIGILFLLGEQPSILFLHLLICLRHDFHFVHHRLLILFTASPSRSHRASHKHVDALITNWRIYLLLCKLHCNPKSEALSRRNSFRIPMKLYKVFLESVQKRRV